MLYNVYLLLLFNFCAKLFLTEIETTGASNEFYDKFSIRYHLSIIFKTMWQTPQHQLNMIEEAE